MPPKKQMKMEDIASFSGEKSDSPGSNSSTASAQPEGATAFHIATSHPVRVKEENDYGYEDPHKHQFTVEFSKDDKYTINCDQPCTVLEAIKSKNKAKKMITCVDENIIIQMGTGDDESIVPTHFPCSCIRDQETLIIKCATKPVEDKRQDSKMVYSIYSKDQYSVFYIDTKRGKNAKTRKMFRNNKVKDFKYLCIYGEKEMTVKEALKRDGRFIDDLGYFELININDKCKTECTDKIDSINNQKFQICFLRQEIPEMKDANEKTHHKQRKQNRPNPSNISQRKAEISSVLAVAWEKGISVKSALKETGSSVNLDEIQKLLEKQYPLLKKLMESRFPGHSYEESLNLRKENFGKIQQSFNEVHRVRELLKLGESVCLLRINISDSSSVQGTGFVLFDKIVLTNAHLFKYWIDSKVSDWHTFVEVTAVFNFEKQNSDKNEIKAKVVVGKNELDYALLELETEEEIPPGLLKRFGPLPPDGEACIVGHPKGEVKKMDPTCIIEKEQREEAVNKNLQDYQKYIFTLFSINQVIKNDTYENICVTYNTFMYHGSSGSPVFDAHGQVFGLHSGGFFFGFPKANESVIEFAFPLLLIFRDLVANLKNSGFEKLLDRIEEAARGNAHLENIIASVVGPKQGRPEESLEGVQETTEKTESEFEAGRADVEELMDQS